MHMYCVTHVGVEMREQTIDRRAVKMLEALKACGPGWHSRREIANALGKTRLTDGDVIALELLTREGKIEAERHEVEAVSGVPVRMEYQLKEAKESKRTSK